MTISEVSMKHITQFLFSCYRNVRVQDWRAYVGITFLGFIQNLNGSLSSLVNVFLKFMITIILYLAFTFSINNCFDVGCDIHNNEKLKKNSVADGSISFKVGLIFSLSIAFIGLASVYLCFKIDQVILYSLLVFLGGAYSAPPIRFKSIPLIDLLSHGLFFGILLYFYGASITGRLNTQSTFLGISIFLYSIILEMRNHLKDFKADVTSGTKTTVCWLGYVKAEKILEMLLIIHCLFLIVISVYIDYIHATVVLGIIIAIILSRLLQLDFSHFLKLIDFGTCIAYIVLSINTSQIF
jgi:4-hydroxybenzoate polyprenyltransferase